jgi:hypothetical protein
MRLLACLIAAVASFGQQLAPEAAGLVRRAVDVRKANSEKASLYAYREYSVTRDLDKSGQETDRETETWEVIGLEGSSYKKLIQRDDQALSPKEQKREDQRLTKEAERRRKETPQQRRNRLLSFSYSLSFSPAEMESLYDLTYKGEEMVNGRTAHLVEGTPKSGVQPSNDNAKELLNFRVKVWFDREDFIDSRVEMEVIGDRSRLQKGSVVDATSFRSADGVWLTQEIRFRYNIRFFKMMSARGERTISFSDYRKFQVDSRLVE